MSEQDAEDKTEKPSEKRLREAREKGEVPRSRDLSGALVVLAGVAGLMSSSDKAFLHARNIYTLGMSYSRDALFSGELPGRVLHEAVSEALSLFAPIAMATVLATLAAPMILGGLSFSAQALEPKFDRLNPIPGLGRIVSMRGLVELVKSLLKLLFIGSALAWVLWNSQDAMQATGRGTVSAGIAMALGVLGRAALLFGTMLAIIGGIDAGYQKYDHAKKLRMTKQEVRDEMKESEGNPEMKGRMRQVAQQLARRRMMQELPNADVVVTNPTHFAVALKYDDGKMRAPRVIAKGVDIIAMQIRSVAEGHRIPMVEAPPLARALYATTELGREIPATLYVAVAQVLAYVFQLRQATLHGDTPPTPPSPQVDPDLQGPYKVT